MKTLYLVCTRSAISASALVYTINQSPDFYNTCHNNLWLSETSTQFGTAYTLNDWWNVPLSFSAYTANIRNASALTLADLHQLSQQFQQSGIQRNLAVFTHARNPEQIQSLAQQHSLPIRTVSTIMGPGSHVYVPSWIKREFSTIMNPWQGFLPAWQHLANQRIVQDTVWSRNACVLQMSDWLDADPQVYNKLGIAPAADINQWLTEYSDKNSIPAHVDPDHYWQEGVRGNTTKMCVFLLMLNRILEQYPNDPNLAQLYAHCIHEFHVADVMTHYTELDRAARHRLGIA